MPEASATAAPGNAAGTAMERSQLYGFLAAIFRAEPTAALLRQIKEPDFASALAAAGVAFGDGFLDGAEAELLEELAVEYTALFIGPGEHVAPYASVYLDGQGGTLWGPSTLWVSDIIASAGFDYGPGYHDLPDHVSVELEFMQHLAAQEAQAREVADAAVLAECRKIEEEFVTAHLAAWTPRFCRKVAARAESPFYREMAGLARDFIRSEADEFASSGRFVSSRARNRGGTAPDRVASRESRSR